MRHLGFEPLIGGRLLRSKPLARQLALLLDPLIVALPLVRESLVGVLAVLLRDDDGANARDQGYSGQRYGPNRGPIRLPTAAF